MTHVFAGASAWYLAQWQPWAPVTSHAVDILLRLNSNDLPPSHGAVGGEALQRLDGAAAHGGAASRSGRLTCPFAARRNS